MPCTGIAEMLSRARSLIPLVMIFIIFIQGYLFIAMLNSNTDGAADIAIVSNYKRPFGIRMILAALY